MKLSIKSIKILPALLLKNHIDGEKALTSMNDEETLDYLLSSGKGIVRYGNSELSYMAGLNVKTQKQNKYLRQKLIKIIEGQGFDDPYIIGYPIDMIDNKYSVGRSDINKAWGLRVKLSGNAFVKNGGVYYSPFVFRMKDVLSQDIFLYSLKLASLFHNKDIIYVGPKTGKNCEPPSGIEYKSIINIPESNCFSYYHDIYQKVINESKEYSNPLVLLVAGITATALSYDLNNVGIKTYDLGQMARHLNFFNKIKK